MGKNRIALISHGGMLGQMVLAALEQDPEVELVPTGSPDPVGEHGKSSIDLLILVIPGGKGVAECRDLLRLFPSLRALAVLEDFRGNAGLYELYPRETNLGALSPSELSQRIRDVLQGREPSRPMSNSPS